MVTSEFNKYTIINVTLERGKRGVSIKQTSIDIEFSTCRNGYQWAWFPVDEELLVMMRDSIDEFLLKFAHQKL